MLIRFDTIKVTQAACVLLKRYNGFITRKRLLKLLYITDRELIQQIAPYTHKLLDDPGIGKLSTLELAKLDEVTQRY